jgi:prepilin-type N-terminal cleavage/methylation domain-containing protein
MCFKNTLRGFSLVELLVYITIFSIVSASIWQAFIWFQKNHINFTQQQKISFDIDRVYDLLSKDILNTDPTQIIYNSNCLDFGNIKYYLNVDSSSKKGTLYRSESCSPSDQKLLENIIIGSDKFFVIGPQIPDPNSNQLIPDPNSKYKTITYSLCCNTSRTVFSAFSQ